MEFEKLENARKRCAKKTIIAIVITLAILAGVFPLLFLGNQSFVNHESVFTGTTMLFGTLLFMISIVLDIKSITDFVDFLQLDHKLFKTNQETK